MFSTYAPIYKDLLEPAVMNHTYHLPLFLVFHTNLSYIALRVATSRYDEYNW
jgi:hypothetical protein